MVFSDLHEQRIQRERHEWKRFPDHFPEDESVRPVCLKDVAAGSICRMWFTPNQGRFVAIGNAEKLDGDGITSIVVRNDGNAMGVLPDCLVVVLSQPPNEFPNLIADLAQFNAYLKRAAWSGREGSC